MNSLGSRAAAYLAAVGTIVVTAASPAAAAAENPAWSDYSPWNQGCYDAVGVRAWAAKAGRITISDMCEDGLRAYGIFERKSGSSWVRIGTIEDLYDDNSGTFKDFRPDVTAGWTVRLRTYFRDADTGALTTGANYSWAQWTAS